MLAVDFIFICCTSLSFQTNESLVTLDKNHHISGNILSNLYMLSCFSSASTSQGEVSSGLLWCQFAWFHHKVKVKCPLLAPLPRHRRERNTGGSLSSGLEYHGWLCACSSEGVDMSFTFFCFGKKKSLVQCCSIYLFPKRSLVHCTLLFLEGMQYSFTICFHAGQITGF